MNKKARYEIEFDGRVVWQGEVSDDDGLPVAVDLAFATHLANSDLELTVGMIEDGDLLIAALVAQRTRGAAA